MEGQGDAGVGIGTPLGRTYPVFFTGLADHDAASPQLFHQAAQVEDVGNVRVTQD